jgi:hypothetical protein
MASLVGQDTAIRLAKPQNVFFYPQVNIHGGYESGESRDRWGLANRGPQTQVAFELYQKAETRLQRGYTRSIEPLAWSVKWALELDPDEQGVNDAVLRPRLYDSWLELDTKWDRTSVWVGHKQIPYGHNPRVDPNHSFLPNQAALDLTFGRDTGLFFLTPVTSTVDVEISLTVGKGDTWDYHGGWLCTARFGSPTFEASEIGVFALVGSIQETNGSITTSRTLTDVVRLGSDWVYKVREQARIVNQISVGANRGGGTEDLVVANMLNSIEWFVRSRMTIGLTHALSVKDFDGSTLETETRGILMASVSLAVDRDVRFRINPFVEYRDSTGKEDWGVLFQFCYGCGLTK